MRSFFILFLNCMLVTGTCSVQAAETGTNSASAWDPAAGPQNTWVYIVVSSYNTVEPKIQEAAKSLGPQFSGQLGALPAQIKKTLSDAAGGSLSEKAIDGNRPFAIVINNPMGGNKPAFIIPVKNDAEIADTLKPVHNYVVASDNPMVSSQLASLLKKAGENAIVNPSGLVHIYINAETIYNTFGPFLQLVISQQINKQGLGQQARLGSVMANTFFSVFSQVLDIQVSLDLSSAELNTHATVTVKNGSSLASFCSDQEGGTSLAPLIDTDGFLSANGRIKGMPAIMFNLTDKILAVLSQQPDELQEIRDSLSRLSGSLGEEFAFNEAMTPAGLTYEGVVEFAGDMQQIRSYLKMLTADKIPAALRTFAGASTVMPGISGYSVKESVRIVEGVSVDRFTSKLSDKELDPNTASLMKTIWGGNEIAGEYAVKDGKLFMCGGGNDYTKRLDTLLSKASNTKGTAEKIPVAFSIDFLKLMKLGMQMQGRQTPPPPAGDIPPVSGTVTFSDTGIVNDVAIPLKMIPSFIIYAQNAAKATPGFTPQNN